MTAVSLFCLHIFLLRMNMCGHSLCPYMFQLLGVELAINPQVSKGDEIVIRVILMVNY